METTGRRPDPANGGSRSTRAERAWNGVCWTMIIVGAFAHVGWFGWASAVTAFVSSAFAFWLIALCGLDDVRSRRWQLVEWSLLASGAVVAVAGLWALAQGWSVVVALILAGSHPRVVSWVLRPTPSRVSRHAADPSATDGSAPAAATHPAAKAAGFGRPSRLSDDALRRCWEATWTLLQDAKTLDEAVRIVKYRQSCLDEIARRNGASFHLWVEAGMPNSDEPARELPATFEMKPSS